jgi:L-lactate dehydrogenase
VSERTRSTPPKIAVIGAGMVGASLAYSLVVERVAGEVVLVDLDKDRAAGEAMDINHAVPFSAPTRVSAGGYDDCEGADLFVITAGIAQKPGETRLNLVAKNVEIFKRIIPSIMKVSPDPILVIVSNPVDVLTYVTIKLSGLPWRSVIGSGTVLDTARLRYELGAHCGVDPRNVHAYILGEHGDSEVPAWSLANVGGLQYDKFCEQCGRCEKKADFTEIFERVRNAAYEIIRLKGATYFAIALGATRMLEAILRDQNTVTTASVLLQGEYGIEDVCLSLPVVLGREGAREVIRVPLSDEETGKLRQSAETLKGTLRKVGF